MENNSLKEHFKVLHLTAPLGAAATLTHDPLCLHMPCSYSTAQELHAGGALEWVCICHACGLVHANCTALHMSGCQDAGASVLISNHIPTGLEVANNLHLQMKELSATLE